MNLENARQVIDIEANALKALTGRLDESFDKAVELMFNCEERIVLTGMGKSGIICRKIAATLASTGSPSLFIHPAEAIHGDLGMLKEGDVVLALSNSGETRELLNLIPFIKRLGVPLISISGDMDSNLVKQSDVSLDVSIEREACPMDLVPTASTTAALAMGDALAVSLLKRKNFKERDFAKYHPGGQIGQTLLTVEDLMHTGESIPKASPDTPLDELVVEISEKGFGVGVIVDSKDRLLGIITDGDLRRTLKKKLNLNRIKAGDIMTPDPITIGKDEAATKALNIMEENKITSLVVVDDERKVKALVHLHDLWRTEMF